MTTTIINTGSGPGAVESVTYHRNGSFGAGYYAVRLRMRHGKARLLAIVFDASEHVAIMDDNGDSWRCEHFEAPLRGFINSYRGQVMAFPYLAGTAERAS